MPHELVELERSDVNDQAPGGKGVPQRIRNPDLINARDALIARKVGSPMISITLFTQGGKTVVTIADNAGGIPEGMIDKIF